VAEVFINYRRDDGDAVADLIALYLSQRFGAEHVFKASRSISPGTEYRSALNGAVRDCEVLLAVMGPDWSRSERLRDRDDWVRNEILEAFAANKCVIPVLSGRMTDRLRAADLPQELARLAYLQSRRFDTQTSQVDLDQIGQAVIDLVPGLRAAERSESAVETVRPGTTDNSASDVSGTVVQSGTIGGHAVNISDTRGPTQVGDGSTQNNYLGPPPKVRQPRQQPIDRLRWLADRFVRPPDFDVAAAALRKPGTVVLDGQPGSGRTTAAKMLLLGSSSEAELVHELTPEEPGEETPFWLRPDSVGRDDRVWVDLSDLVSPGRWDLIQRDLLNLHARVQECNARLVIVKPYDAELLPEFRELRRTIGRPSATAVFSHLLEAEGLLHGEHPALPGFLADKPSMSAIRQFIDYVLDARDHSAGGNDLANWIAAAQERASPQEEHVAKALTTLTGAPERALLLSVAMLHGAHADVIDRAATALLASLQDVPSTALGRSPLRERLAELGAELDIRQHVRFTRRGYEFAVRAFFWKHFPELHVSVATLVRDTLDSRELDEAEERALACDFADQCLEWRYQGFWSELVKHLATQSPSPSRKAAAVAVLRRGLHDRNSGRAFRQQIYQWSTGDLSLNLADVLVEACMEMADAYPEQALVRLHHVVRRRPEQTSARQTLIELACSAPWLLSYFLYRLAETQSLRAPDTDARLFLDIANAGLFTTHWTASRLIARRRIAGSLAKGWALAFARLSAETWVPAAREWLRHAAEDDANRDALLDVLVAAAGERADLLSRLFGVAHRAEFRDAISRPLLKKISAAQGVDR
jgi:hypothetical protein